MAERLTDQESNALAYLYGGGDETIECHRLEWVVTRYSHGCWSVLHAGPATVPAGRRMVRETAKVDGQFGTCYTCESCVRLAIAEDEGA
jgi:hypothetical protein